jgi:hypothetical protein
MYDHLFTGAHDIPKTASPTMLEAVDAGLVPIGKRFFNQDITSIMEQPNLTPGRSLTAKIAGLVPGLFDPAADVAVKRAVDRMGDFWHNTLLWDRIGDLQMGLYVNFRDAAMAKGVDPQTAQRMAAHIANRYAGALPQEAMSDSARKIANMMMFSRSFTLGNIGVIKDTGESATAPSGSAAGGVSSVSAGPLLWGYGSGRTLFRIARLILGPGRAKRSFFIIPCSFCGQRAPPCRCGQGAAERPD